MTGNSTLAGDTRAEECTGPDVVHKHKHWNKKDHLSLDEFPVEIIMAIVNELQLQDICHFSYTCNRLYHIIFDNDGMWKQVASQEFNVKDCAPYSSFKDLCMTLYRYRWLRPGIWHGNRSIFGSLCISAYNSKNGSLELYNLAIQRRPNVDRTIPITGSNLHDTQRPGIFPVLDEHMGAMVSLNAKTEENELDGSIVTMKQSSFIKITIMRCHAVLVKQIYPAMKLWPPNIIPSLERTCDRNKAGFKRSYRVAREPSQNLIRVKKALGKELIRQDDDPDVGHEFCIETYSRLLDHLLHRGPHSLYQGLWIADFGRVGKDSFVLMHSPSKYRLEAVLLTTSIDYNRGDLFLFVDDMSCISERPAFIDYDYRMVITARSRADNRMDDFCTTSLIIVNDDMMINYYSESSTVIFYRVELNDLLKLVDGILE